MLRIEQGTQNIAKAVEKIVDAHRQQFYGGLLGKIAPRISHIAKSSEEWQRIYRESEEAAKRSLIGGTSISKLDTLRAAAEAAQAEAEAAQRELDRLFHEHRSIPAKADELKNRLNIITAERAGDVLMGSLLATLDCRICNRSRNRRAGIPYRTRR